MANNRSTQILLDVIAKKQAEQIYTMKNSGECMVEHDAIISTLKEYYPDHTYFLNENLKKSLMTTVMDVKIGNGLGYKNNLRVLLYVVNSGKFISYRKL
jgi:hypothetical protein